eukprot:Gb_29884 [translate_table: standard]
MLLRPLKVGCVYVMDGSRGRWKHCGLWSRRVKAMKARTMSGRPTLREKRFLLLAIVETILSVREDIDQQCVITQQKTGYALAAKRFYAAASSMATCLSTMEKVGIVWPSAIGAQVMAQLRPVYETVHLLKFGVEPPHRSDLEGIVLHSK